MKIEKIEWSLPKPDNGPHTTWHKVPKPPVKRTYVPFGYMEVSSDPDYWYPVPFELELLEEAKAYVKEYSWRDVADWLTAESGRKISWQGLKKRIEIEKSRKQQARALRKHAEKLQAYIQAAEELEAKIGGAATRTYDYTETSRTPTPCIRCGGSGTEGNL